MTLDHQTVDNRAAGMLFEVLVARHDAGSIVFTTNRNDRGPGCDFAKNDAHGQGLARPAVGCLGATLKRGDDMYRF